MQKVLLLLGALAGLAGSAQGQTIRYGLKAGVSLAQLTSFNSEVSQSRVGVTAGLMADAALGERLALHPELLFSQKGQRFEGSGPGGFTSTDLLRLNYLDLPILLRLKFGNFFAEAGPQAGYLLSANSSHTQSPTPYSTSSNTTEGLRRLDAGYVVGMGYQLLGRWEVNARYNGGLLSVFSGGNGTAANSVFQFQAGYLLGGE